MNKNYNLNIEAEKRRKESEKDNKKKILDSKIKKTTRVVRCCLFILFAIAGIEFLIDGNYKTGIFCILFGINLFPQLWDMIEYKFGWYNKWLPILIGALLFFFLVGMFFGEIYFPQHYTMEEIEGETIVKPILQKKLNKQ